MSETITLSPEETKILRDFINFGGALTNSLTANQIVGLATSLGSLMPLMANLSNPGMQKLLNAMADSSDNLADLITMVNEYHQAGSLKKGLELIAFLGVLRDAMSTETIVRMVESASSAMLTGDQLMSQVGGLDRVKALAETAQEAAKEAERDTSEIGVFGLMKTLKEPQVQKGIKFMLHFLQKVGQK